MASAVARMGGAPCPNSGQGFRSSVVILVLRLRQPFELAGLLACRFAQRRPTVTLMPCVARVRRKSLPAMNAFELVLSLHFVSPPTGSRDGLLHDLGRKPKKTKAAKKTQVSYQAKEENPNQENPVSRRLAVTRFRLAATSGRGRMDREHLREGVSPKAVWVYPLVPDAAERLRRPA